MLGTVGTPLPGVDLRLEAVPELGYLPSDKKGPKGEVRVAAYRVTAAAPSPCLGWFTGAALRQAFASVSSHILLYPLA